MLGLIVIFIFTLYLAFLFPIRRKQPAEAETDPKIDSQMKKLWTIAQDSMKARKPMRAEKALLTILKFDEKNAAAYNRLGILYAKGEKFDEAIECFEIAQSLDNNASSLHNAGLIYLETGAYEKAEMAFKQALELEGDVPARFMALAKAEEKLGNRKAAIEALEAAYDLDHTTSTLRQILALYESAGDTEQIAATTARIEAQIAENAKAAESARRSRIRAAYRKANKNNEERNIPKTPVQRTRRLARPSLRRTAEAASPRPAPAVKAAVKTTKTSSPASVRRVRLVRTRVKPGAASQPRKRVRKPVKIQ